MRSAPIPELLSRTAPHLLYGLAVLDRYGRLAERAMLHALGWTPAQAMSFTVVLGSVLVAPATEARTRIGTDLYLRLPVGIRRACRLAAGDRVLLVADPIAGRLLLHPPVALDVVLTARHAAMIGGVTP